MKPAIYCADIGSIIRNNFGWAGLLQPGSTIIVSSDINELVECVASDLNNRLPVALGFECPLFVPFGRAPEDLLRNRSGERDRSWSASAGAQVLTIGIAQINYTLSKVQSRLAGKCPVFLDWAQFSKAGQGLFVWEAFVSGNGKHGQTQSPHTFDARTAVNAFDAQLSNSTLQNAIRESTVHSLIGAALLRTGWTEDVSLLSQPCVVIKG